MIDLYTWRTPNGRKISIALEEMGLPYIVKVVDISNKEQFTPEFVHINPNSKIPAIYDHDTSSPVFESGAILVYLAEKTGKFLKTSGRERTQALEWLFLQAASFGPNFGQLNHFRNAPDSLPYAINRFQAECDRLLGVLDRHLGKSEYLAGSYSIADMMYYPWLINYARYASQPDSLIDIKRYLELVGKRPGVVKGMAIPA